MENEALERKINDLAGRVNILESKPGFLDRNLDNLSKEIIEDVVSDRIIDIVWNDYFYYSTFFEGSAGYRIDFSGSGSTVIAATHIAVKTGTTNASTAYFQKRPANQKVLKWDKESRFRLQFDVSEVTNQEVRMSVGDSSDGVTDSHYGFFVDNAILKGTSSFNTTTETVTLLTITASTTYNLEAQYFPGNRVDFYVNDDFKGSVSDGNKLPSKEATAVYTDFFTFFIKNTAAEAKIAECSWFEYIQQR